VGCRPPYALKADRRLTRTCCAQLDVQMKSSASACIALVALLASACSSNVRQPQNARSQLAAADSAANWPTDSTVVGDIDCDGLQDTAMVGHRDKDIRVGIVFGATRPPDITTIPVAPAAQDALPTTKVSLRVESIDYDPAKNDGGELRLEGFQQSKSCIGLNLSDGNTDSMHMYWNHVAKRLDWWRL
jgi:hypothetical protein